MQKPRMHKPRVLTFVALALLSLSLAGACKKVTQEPPLDTKTPVPPPADLLVEASLPKLEGGLAGAGAYADRVQPGVGAMVDAQLKPMIAQAVGLTGLDGAKGDAPVRLLVLDPAKGPRKNALLVGVGDEKKLRESAKAQTLRVQDGQALIGDKAAVERLAPYAFATLAKKAPPAAPAATVYVPALLTAYRDDIMKARDQMKGVFAAQAGAANMAKIFDAEFEGVIGLLERSDAIELRIDATAEIAGVDIAFVPKAGSDLATFVAAQKPAGPGLLARLPARDTPPSIVFAGHLELGPLRDKIRPLLEDMFAQFLGMPMDDESRKALDSWFDDFTGEMAAVGDFGAGGMRFTQLAGVADGPKAMEKARTLFEHLIGTGSHTADVFGMKMTITGTPDAGTHDGVKLMGYEAKIDRSDLPPQIAETQQKLYGEGMRSTFGGWDDVVGISVGPDGAQVMPTLIDASRGKAPRLELAPGIAKLLEDSRARGESLAYVMNLSGILSAVAGAPASPGQSGLVFALGFQGGRAHLRLALPAEHLLELKSSMGGR